MELVHFRTFGKGPCLFILHGMYGMSDNWMSIARAISENYSVVLPDMRNHGHSFHSDVHTYKEMAGDIENLALHLGINKFFLAGHSMGGKTAMYYSMKYPEKLEGLVVFDIAPYNYSTTDAHYEFHVHLLKSMSSVVAEKLRSREEASEILGPMLADERLLNFILKNLGKKPDGSFYWMLNLPVLISSLENMALGFDDVSAVSGFPVHFVRGERSFFIQPEHYPSMKKLYPVHDITTIPDAGHWLHQEQPGLISEFLIKLAK